MTNYVEMVREFHQKMKLEAPESEIQRLSPEVRLLRLRLITEENGELAIALHERDVVKIADASCDLVYVLAGTAVTHGWKTLPWTPESGQEKKPYLAERAVRQLEEINGHLYFLSIAMGKEHAWRIAEELRNYIRGVRDVALSYGIPFEACFTEVHRSNMTKSPLNEHRKGGKGEGFQEPNLVQILADVGLLGQLR